MSTKLNDPVWNKKHSMMVERDNRSPEQKAKDEKIANEVESEISHNPNQLYDMNYTNLVDKNKCPALYRSLERWLISEREKLEKWKKHYESMREGNFDKASKIYRDIMGIFGEPMTEDVKQRLREWNEEHKEEIKLKNKMRREIKARYKQKKKRK